MNGRKHKLVNRQIIQVADAILMKAISTASILYHFFVVKQSIITQGALALNCFFLSSFYRFKKEMRDKTENVI